MQKVVMIILTSLFLSTQSLEAGVIQSPLDDVIAETDAGEFVGVILVMSDAVDHQKLDLDLKARRTTLAERHYEVITALMEKATDTQGPIIDELNRLETEGKVTEIQPFWIANMIAFEGVPEAVAAMVVLDGVEKIVFDFPVETIQPVKTDGDPPIITTRSQGLDVINAPAAWAMGFTGAGRLVANIDTGVDGNHPAFSARWRGNSHPNNECWFDPIDGSSFPHDHGSHGTHTLGTICGRSHTTPDTVGVAIDAQWIAAGTVDYGGTTSDIIASFQWIADPDGNPGTMDDVPDVVGNSWGYSPFFHGVPHCDNTFWAVMDGCENAGVVVIFSAGNEGSYGSNSLRTPADRADSYFNAFSVGAINGHINGYPIASFSSLGPCVCASGDMNIKPECVAPGVDVRSSVPGGSYQSSGWSGTSMASPHISGTVAILRQVNPNLTVDMIKDIILQSSHDLGSGGEDNTYGHGYIDVYEAVLLAGSGFGYFEGYVYETDNNSPVPATVELVGTGISTPANSSGYYLLAAPAGETYTVRASYHGYAYDEYSHFINEDQTIAQNFYLGPPNISTSPPSYSVFANPGDIVTRDLFIDNDGAGELWFTLNTQSTNRLGGGDDNRLTNNSKNQEPLEYITVPGAKEGDRIAPLYPPVITGQGGPDTFGHKWTDSDEPGGPPVSWIDISGPGTSVSLSDDDYAGPISIGFNFDFYENSYSQLYIGSNGFISFGSGDSEYINTGIPDGNNPNNIIAVLWDDLRPPSGGNIYYYYDSANSRFIVSWVGIPFYYSDGSVNAQAVIYPNGNIEINYGSLDGGSHGLNLATVGIENVNASDGLQIVYDAGYLHSNLSIRISSSWLSAEPGSGVVPGSGGSFVASVILDATDLSEGVYYGDVLVDSDDPDTPNITIPVTFNVGSIVVGTLQGTVTDVFANPISGVQVHADDGGGYTGDTSTNGSGFYTMDLQLGTYTVTFNHPDYYELVIPGVVVVEDQVTTQDAVLEEDTTQVPTLSEWGMIMLSLLLLVFGTIAVIKRTSIPVKYRRI